MITRLTHAAIAFAVTAVLYQAYVLAVAPFIEPAWRVAQATAPPAVDEMMTPAEALHRYRDLLTAYFPPDHWCFAKPPLALENGQALIIFSEYDETPDGKLEVPQCAVIFFPTAHAKSDGPPRDAIIMESELGASLQMEAQKGDFGFGPIQHGVLNGKVNIRSDMREPGPADDLLINTDNLVINEDGIYTRSPVNMRLGPHNGFGRELEIRFSKAEGGGGGGLGGIYGKLEELIVKHDVTMTAQLGQQSLFDKPAASPPGQPGSPAPPIHIQSAGPFRLNFNAKVASFNDQVRARQTYPDGKLDQLFANELKLNFTTTTKWNSEGDGVVPTNGSPGFDPASIEALGSPVILSAQSHDAAAEGKRLFINLGLRLISLEGGDEVRLSHQGSEIHAPTVQYKLPEKDSGRQIGEITARGGAGWIRAIPDPAQPYRVLDVHWEDALNTQRSNDGQLILILDGRPRVNLTGTGTLWADRLEIFLRELAAGPNAANGASGPLASSVVPELIKASNNVAIESSQLTCKVNSLKVRIDHDNANPAPSAPATGQVVATPISTGGPSAPPPTTLPASNPIALFNPSGAGNGKSYDIQGVTLELDVAMQGKITALRGVDVDGNVLFKETSPVAPGEQPMRIDAEHLKVTAADTPNAQIEISGGGGQNGIPQQIAELTANGAKLRVPAIAVQRGSSQAQVNTPGEVQLLVDRDMQGNQLARPEPVLITWQESMLLNGSELTFLGDVRVQHSSGWLTTRRLVVRTVQPIDFGGGNNGQRPQLEQIECWEGVLAEFDQRDVTGITSRQRMQLQAMQVNQLTGEIRGNGPGTIDSIHLAKGASGLMGGSGAGAPAAPRLMNEEVKLRHLHIDFVRGVGGNMLASKTVKVIGNVEAVYGPVDSWDQRLSMSPGGDPGADTVWITCDELGVTESPIARITPDAARQVELNALGNVVLEGQDKQGKLYNATGGKAMYDQSKGQFILEGDQNRPATVETQAYAGAPKSPQSAQRISFNQNTGIVEAQGLHHASSINPAPK
ncbi:hypothetical protein [Lacipirellula parvula]|uniref:Organic solvent tolerance-like N-terminal domain-containing protein n=1 Tax=Lacipirellula parvula TaxID=2650471 RepID=A0A5K7XK12_9BACT|nr:hypothetical protein [Lacipirellula parvula]BBO36497.1 hypothetical protein PLANPX_6109 [Lacipirellula parvula]